MRKHPSAPEGVVGVLCGGPSAEREISIRSGRAVHEALRSRGTPAVLVELSQDLQQIPEEIRRSKISCAFVVLHGPFGEDGTVQALLEQMGILHTGSSPEASRYAMDKVSARRRWLAARLPVPRWVTADRYSAQSRAQEFLRFPVVVKPLAQGSSMGMSIVDHPEEMPGALEEAVRYDEEILLEEYLPGTELTVGILEEAALPIIQILPKRRFYDTVAKYTPGMCEYIVPAPLPEGMRNQIQQISLKAHETLGCRSFSRVDLILVPGRGPVLLELNTIPGMTNTSLLPKAAQAAGIDFPELCQRMLASAFNRQELCQRGATA
ncbi:MAG: D-alanine--D-alanine ligase [Candidatus Omnitrophica bacterium]|nr:D-alanine--D-alanine ligase [Candidatus Omnitrophota bacterium]